MSGALVRQPPAPSAEVRLLLSAAACCTASTRFCVQLAVIAVRDRCVCARTDRASRPPAAESAISCTAPPAAAVTAPEGGLPGADGVGRQSGVMRTSYPGSADGVQVAPPSQDVVTAGLVTRLLALICAAYCTRRLVCTSRCDWGDIFWLKCASSTELTKGQHT
jgi:hypothetical protein